jgi:hypothetical protein
MPGIFCGVSGVGFVVGLHDFHLFCPRGEKSFVDCITGSLSANAVCF